jgi:hypothetical protein
MLDSARTPSKKTLRGEPAVDALITLYWDSRLLRITPEPAPSMPSNATLGSVALPRV